MLWQPVLGIKIWDTFDTFSNLTAMDTPRPSLWLHSGAEE